jgi:GDP-L-fucose synthase
MMLVQAQSYREQYGFNAIFLVPVNLYGPCDNFDLETSHVIPAMIRKFLRALERGEQRVVLWGDGSPTREFLYVDDAAEGICLATERYNEIHPVNLGTGEEIAIKDLAKLIAKETQYTGDIVWDTSKPNGQPRRCLDVSHAEEFFGFRAKTNFKKGIAQTIEWVEANRLSVG